MEMENKIIEKLIEIDQKVDELKVEVATKTDLREVQTILENQGQILRRLDQERLFMSEHVKRIETDVEHVKEVLHIA